MDFVSLSQTNLTLIDAKINLKSNFLLPIYTIGKSFRLRAGRVEEAGLGGGKGALDLATSAN